MFVTCWNTTVHLQTGIFIIRFRLFLYPAFSCLWSFYFGLHHLTDCSSLALFVSRLGRFCWLWNNYLVRIRRWLWYDCAVQGRNQNRTKWSKSKQNKTPNQIFLVKKNLKIHKGYVILSYVCTFMINWYQPVDMTSKTTSPLLLQTWSWEGSQRRYLSLISPGERIVLTDGRSGPTGAVRVALHDVKSSQDRAGRAGQSVQKMILQYCDLWSTLSALVLSRFELEAGQGRAA